MSGFFDYGWLPIIIASLASAAIMIVGGILTELSPWYRSLAKPSWQPPDWAFGPVWTVIYILVTLGTVLCWNHAATPSAIAVPALAFVLNGLLNIGWSYLFFRLRRADVAVLEGLCLWLSTLLLAVVYYSVLPMAGWLIVPYLLWVSLAIYLNWTVMRLNGSVAGSGQIKGAVSSGHI
jgi:translocator protein